MFSLYTDAATDNATSASAAGILILHAGDQLQLKKRLPDGDNHESEFRAAIAGFQALQDQTEKPSDTTVLFYTDSKIVADSVAKSYAKHYQDLLDDLMTIQSQFSLVITKWVPEKQNQGAHNLALQALHATN